MSTRRTITTLAVFSPHPDSLYSLDATAHLAGVPRRAILRYVQAGFIRPQLLAPHGIMVFDEEALYLVRSIETLRTTHGVSIEFVRAWLELRREVEQLRAELRFHREK